MKNVVITGSTRGIGFGLAVAFLASGCQVVVNGRSQHSVDEACAQLAVQYDPKSGSRLRGGCVRPRRDTGAVGFCCSAHGAGGYLGK